MKKKERRKKTMKEQSRKINTNKIRVTERVNKKSVRNKKKAEEKFPEQMKVINN